MSKRAEANNRKKKKKTESRRKRVKSGQVQAHQQQRAVGSNSATYLSPGFGDSEFVVLPRSPPTTTSTRSSRRRRRRNSVPVETSAIATAKPAKRKKKKRKSRRSTMAEEPTNDVEEVAPSDDVSAPTLLGAEPEDEDEEDEEEDNDRAEFEAALAAAREGAPATFSFGGFGRSKASQGGSSSSWESLVEGLQSEDPSVALMSASEFSAQLLHAATQEQLSGLDASSAVSALLLLLQYEHNGELMLMGVRALYNLLDALPNSARVIVRAEGIQALVGQLLAINYVDVAEEAIRVLHSISQQQPRPCLQAGCMMAMLSFIDFFALPVQRKCAQAVANMASAVDADLTEQVTCCSGNLVQLLNHPDDQVRSSVALALRNLTDVWHGNREVCETLAGSSLVGQLLQSVSDPTQVGVHALTCLRNLCASSSRLSSQALDQGLLSALEGLLRSPKLANPALEVATALFPSRIPGIADEEEEEEREDEAPSAEVVETISSLLLPLALKLYSKVLDGTVRYRCVLLITQLAVWTPDSRLQDSYFPLASVASLAAGVLRSKQRQDARLQRLVIVIVRRLLEALEDSGPLAREGIVEALHEVAQADEDAWAMDRCARLLQEHFPRAEGQSEAQWLATPTVRNLLSMAPGLRSASVEQRDASLDKLARVLLTSPPSAHEWRGTSLEEPLLELLLSPGAPGGQTLQQRRLAFTRAFTGRPSEALRRVLQAVVSDAAGALPRGIQGNPNNVTSMLTLELEGPLGPRVIRVEPASTVDRICRAIRPENSRTQKLREMVESAKQARRLRVSGDDEFRQLMGSEMARIETLNGEDQTSALEALRDVIQRRIRKDNGEDDEDDEEEEMLEQEIEEEPSDRKLYDIFAYGNRLDPSLSLMRALMLAGAPGPELWDSNIQCKYREREDALPAAEFAAFRAPQFESDPLASSLAHLPVSIGPASNALSLLTALHVLSGGDGEDASWQVPSLVAKARQCLDSPIACAGGAFPPWLGQCISSPAIPASIRQEYFSRVALGALRALVATVGEVRPGRGGRGAFSYDGNAGAMRFGRLPRDKVRVSREGLLESAAQVLQMYGGSRGMLEVEYYGEVGVGLGPTLEWFALCSREIQVRSAEAPLWLDVADTSQGGQYVYSPQGLFPAPLAPGSPLAPLVLRRWTFVGQLMAKALMDARLLDLSLSPVFWDWLFQKRALTMQDLRSVYPALGTTLLDKQDSLVVAGLGMTITGHDEWELVEDGAQVDLGESNLQLYIQGHLDCFLGTGVEQQRQAILEGWRTVFDPSSTSVLHSTELDIRLCGDPGTSSSEAWTLVALKRATLANHGYHSESKQVIWLLETLAEFDPVRRKQFLRFVTGSPRLPMDGFDALNPKLTIVEKSTPGRHPDEVLLSVMTCANFLKLPAYSTKEVLVARLIAAQELCGGFSMT